jgi:hypothetical protein
MGSKRGIRSVEEKSGSKSVIIVNVSVLRENGGLADVRPPIGKSVVEVHVKQGVRSDSGVKDKGEGEDDVVEKTVFLLSEIVCEVSVEEGGTRGEMGSGMEGNSKGRY